MLRAFLWALVIFTVIGGPPSSVAGRRGGPITFDATSDGGSWTCFRSAASGTCGGATAQFFNAACDGSTNDDAALAAMIAYGVTNNPALLKVYIPPGSRCVFGGTNVINWSAANGNGVQNILIWAYGATVDQINVGLQVFFQDSTHSALINTVSAGSTSLVVNDGNVGRFSPGDWIMVTGDCLDFALGGYPPNFQFHESALISNIVGSTITISAPLVNSYKQTWPVCTLGSSMGNGGPATIFKLHPSWNTSVEIHGWTITNPSANQINIVNKQATFYDVTVLNNSIGPSGSQSFTSYNGNYVGVEVDKDADTMVFYGGVLGNSSKNFFVQSPSPNNLYLLSLTAYCSIAGGAINTTIDRVTVVPYACDGRIAPGPQGFGAGNSLIVSNTTFPTATGSAQEVNTADVSFSSGTFSMAKTAGSSKIGSFFSGFVPGFKYKFAWHNAGASACTPLAEFTISDISEDASNYYATISNCSWGSCSGALPTPSCSGSPTTYSLYNLLSVTQANTGSSPSLAGFAAP